MQPGTQIGHYEILSLLGKRGMGEVWRARDTKLGREVAIKTLSEEDRKLVLLPTGAWNGFEMHLNRDLVEDAIAALVERDKPVGLPESGGVPGFCGAHKRGFPKAGSDEADLVKTVSWASFTKTRLISRLLESTGIVRTA